MDLDDEERPRFAIVEDLDTGVRRVAAPLVPVLDAAQLTYNAGILACAVAGLRVAERDYQGAYDILLRCWRFDIARECRFYHRSLAPDLVRLAMALGHEDVAADVARVVGTGAALAPDVPTVVSLALRCQGLVDGDADALLDAVALARQAPHLVEHTGACEDAAKLLAETGRRAESVALLQEALHRHEQAGAEVITAGDMSCLMHLQGLIARQKKPLKVMHVAEILFRARLDMGSE